MNMKQLLVFGLGMGGEAVADYLESELSTIEIVRLIDWRGAFYNDLLPHERNQEIVEQLRPYLMKVEVIVLGSYLLSLSLPYLKRCFPEQKFVGVSVNIHRIMQNIPGCVPAITLMNPVLRNSLWFDELCLSLDFVRLSVPNCAGWDQLIDEHTVSPDILRADLCDVNSALRQRINYKRRGRPRRAAPPLAEQISIEHTDHGSQTAAQSMLQIQENIKQRFHPGMLASNASARTSLLSHKKPPTSSPNHSSLRSPARQGNPRRITNDLPRLPTRQNSSPTILPNSPGLVLLLSTHFWSIRPELEQIFGWRVKIMDFRKQLLHDVCFALGFRGVHGGRAK